MSRKRISRILQRMDGEEGRRNCTIRRTSPVTKSSGTPPRARSYPYGTEYGTPHNERAIDVHEDIYRTPQTKSFEQTSKSSQESTRTPRNSDSENAHLTVETVPFSDRNGSLRSPVRGPRPEKLQNQRPSVNTLKRESDAVRRASRTPSGNTGESSWAGYKLVGKVDGMTPSIRSYWQQNISREQKEQEEASRHVRPKSYGFPKWRSSDALSASLVASNPVEIPKDSRIPEQRRRKMEQTDMEAAETKQQIQQSIEPSSRLHKGKSLDSLVMQTENQPWYDRAKIRDAVSRESIANIGEARQRFESGDFHSHRRERSYSSNSSRFEPPPLPPKSEEVQLRQKANRAEIQDYPVESYQSPLQPSHQYRQNGYAHQQPNDFTPNGHTRDTPLQYSYEQQLLLLFLKQNPELINSVGVQYPDMMKHAIEEIPWRRVELKAVDDEANSYLPITNSNSPNQRGRYVKKYQTAATVHPPRFRKYEPPRLEPRREEIKGESLIAAEIRSSREREDELRRSRSELGLPTLEDTMDLWRNGQMGLPPLNPLRGAVSYDLHHQTGASPLHKAGSIGELSQDSYSQYGRKEDFGARPEMRNGRVAYAPAPYKLQNTEDQDVMIYGPPRRQPPPLKRFE